MASTASLVKKTIARIKPGTLFGYNRFNATAIDESALAMALSRLTSQGEIVRLSKGKYYKPEQSRFGQLRPRESVVVEALTNKNGEQTGYLTGINVYNRLGLTTQVSNVLEIASKKPLPPKNIQGYKVKYQKRDLSKIRRQDIPLLQLLDAIKDIKTIPDTSVDDALQVLIEKIDKLTINEQKQMVKLADSYNAATRALLGAMLQQLGSPVPTQKLSDSLNKLTKYNIGINEKLLPNRAAWNIQ
ncbi:DUF6088 family protein [Nafulsella turpanensis]|uniref:DUF6088 family protein n=1 Tax=Nafulsella turpanensis TaxID=1265690 RepID=UPI000345E72D|nr:DUF6088 family protein [Nafulsella turpanensis]